MRRLLPVLFVLFAATVHSPVAQEGEARAAADPEVPGVVRVGEDEPVVVSVGSAGRTAVERAEAASRVLRETLADPACDADRFAVVAPEPGVLRIVVCGRTILGVSETDAAAEGVPADQLAVQWRDRLRTAWTKEKSSLFSRRLVEAAILGVLYPLVFLVLIVLLRMVVRRVQRWLESIGGAEGIRIGPVLLTAEEGDRGLLSRLAGLLGWVGYLLLAYVFLIALFDRFPRTARWAREMLGLLGGFGSATGTTLLGLVPRLLALVLLLVIARVLLRSVGRMFEQVRARKLRIDPILTPDTVGPAEITARVLILGVFVFLAGLLVPGDAGTALLASFALVGLAMAIGSRPLVENFFAGVVVLYGRPFRTGEAVRIGSVEGVVEHKGFLHLRVRLRDDRIAFIPNRRLLLEDARVVDADRAIRAEVVLRPLRDDCVPEGLFRHAAAEAGLRRDDGRVELVEVRDGDLVFRVSWPLPSQADVAASRDALFRSMAARGKGLGVEVRSAREESLSP